MEDIQKTKKFESALYGVCENIRGVLLRLPDIVKQNAEEIRLRCGLPVALTIAGETVFVLRNGQTSFCITRELLKAEKSDLEESFKLLCQSSVYAHGEELKNGFVIMKHGHRAGICGTLTESGALLDISSVNIRIAREILGAANDIARCYNGGGLLIAGPPGSGKTTVLRDLIRQLSGGMCKKNYRVAVIDSRGEISGSAGGTAQNDLGACSDVLLCADKALGIEIALRTLYPDIIAFDEIGRQEELKQVSESLNAGVDIITTAHIGGLDDIMRRSVTAELIQSGAVKWVAVLPKIHGGTVKLLGAAELLNGVAV